MRGKEHEMADGPESEVARASEEAIRSRVEELLAGMTTAEKAGQLTQYFYFGFYRGKDDVPTVSGARPSAGGGRGRDGARRGGVAACSSPIRRRSTACSGWPSKAAGSASRSCSATT